MNAEEREIEREKQYNIVASGTGYVGMSMAILLAQHHNVTVVDIILEKSHLINRRKLSKVFV